MVQRKFTLKVICAASVASFFITICVLMSQKLPLRGRPHCVSARGCDVDFAQKVRELESRLHGNDAIAMRRELNSLKEFDRSLHDKDIAEVESIYKSEVMRMQKEMESLQSALVAARNVDDTPSARSRNCSSLLVNDGRVRSCVTGDIIGKVPLALETATFKMFQGGSPESAKTREDSFQGVFEKKAWGQGWDADNKGLGVSGMGATLTWTQEAIATLNIVITDIKRDLGVSRVRLLDVPCGDMTWMSRFLQTRDDVDYLGIDIVDDLIEHHRVQYKYYPGWRFEARDIVTNPVNESFHLILCRTLLQHLYYHDAMSVLQQFSTSGSHYLLTTTWSRHAENQELQIEQWNPGRMRRLNLELPPVSLSPPRCLQRDGPPNAIEGWDHFLGLWKLPLFQVKGCQDVYEEFLPHTEIKTYSCVDWLINR